MNSEAIEMLVKKNPRLASKREKLEAMEPGRYCMHGTWGLGLIKEYNKDKNRLVIDFAEFKDADGKPKLGHEMDPAFCVDKLDILPDDNVLVRSKNDAKTLDEQMTKSPADFVASVLEKKEDKSATATELENLFRKLFSSQKEFRSWWNKTKKALLSDPRIACPKNKGDSYILRDEEVKPEQEILQEYFLNREPKKKILLAEKLYEIVENESENKNDEEKQKVVDEIKNDLEKIKDELTEAIKKARSLNQADRLHGIWVRNNLIRYLFPGKEEEVEKIEPRSKDIIADAVAKDPKNGLNDLARNLPATYYERFLDLLTRIYTEDWRNKILGLLKDSEGRFTNECVNFLIDRDSLKESKIVKGLKIEADKTQPSCKELVKDSLYKWLDEQTLHGPVILWIVKNRNASKVKDILKGLIGPKLLTAMLSAIDDEALLSDSNRRIALAEFMSEDKKLISDMLEGAPLETARDLAQSLILNQGFEDLSKKSILARFIMLYPEIQELVSDDNTKQESKAERLFVSAWSMQARRDELEEIIKVKMPESKRRIEAARELGDLRENSEYKMAREDDELLSAKRMQLEREIPLGEVIDFTDVTNDTIGIGSVVGLLSDGKESTYTILGAWDADSSKNIYSYKTPLSQMLLGKHVGDVVETNIDGHKTRWEVKSIARWIDVAAR